MIKRLFDIAFSATALVVLSPLLLGVAIAIKLDSPGPVLFRGVRVGRHGREFRLSKFRTMVLDAPLLSHVYTTPTNDPRITRLGRILRRYNLDELPQFFDVLRGKMSVVGPRPEVPHYVAMFTEEQRQILSIRPGITDWASLWIGDKGVRVDGAADPEEVYIAYIRPEKLRLQLEYVRNRSMVKDLAIIAGTFRSHILGPLTGSTPIAPPVTHQRGTQHES